MPLWHLRGSLASRELVSLSLLPGCVIIVTCPTQAATGAQGEIMQREIAFKVGPLRARSIVAQKGFYDCGAGSAGAGEVEARATCGHFLVRGRAIDHKDRPTRLAHTFVIDELCALRIGIQETLHRGLFA